MTKRRRLESNIRDWLADNLEFIAPGLSLIEKEYFLPDAIGSSGYVDLLCKDQFNNFVVIEIKRSENSARQTISEILKYHSLIKHNFRARESEIRTIIISTSWNELIRPFSETIHRTSLDLTGYSLSISENGVPISIEKVEPLAPSMVSRKFAYWKGLFLFETEGQREDFYNDFRNYLQVIEMEDLALLRVVGDVTDQRIMFPYGVIFSFQKMNFGELMTTIKRLNSVDFDFLLPQTDFDDEHEYRSYLELAVINALDSLGHFHESESCYPQKVYTMLNGENWTIEKIERFGIFDNDPRYTSELLINELTGLDGNNEDVYFGFTESTQIERLREILEECRNALRQSPAWLDTIEVIMEKLRTEKRKFRLLVNIFNRQSLVASIYHALVNKEFDYLPQYFISIDFLDSSQTELYYGSILWNGNWPDSPWLKPFPTSEKGDKLYEVYTQPDNQTDAQEMGLCYGTTKYLITDTDNKFQGFYMGKNGELVEQSVYIFPFVQFAVIHADQLSVLVANHDRSYLAMRK